MFMTDIGVQYEEPRQFVETGTVPMVSMFKLGQDEKEVITFEEPR